MADINCPKCGRAVEAGAFICPVCEYILDTSFLGEDITDDERDKRKQTAPGGGGGLKKTVENPAQAGAPAVSVNFGEDAIILGNGAGEYSDFETKDAGMTREVTHARFYIGGNTAAILHIDAVPEIAPGILEGSLKMSPFERHVLGFINGKRSIGRIQKKSAMEDMEFKTSVAMLADKGIIRLRTTKKRKNKDTGAPSAGPSRSVSGGASSAPSNSSGSGMALNSQGGDHALGAGGADRTVVASFEQISAEHARQSAAHAASSAALAAEAEAAGDDMSAVPTRALVRGSRTSAAEPTIIKSSDAAAKAAQAKKSAGGPGFASVRLQGGTGEHPPANANAGGGPPPILVDDALADEWGADDAANNISNVFARASAAAGKGKKKVPSLADAPPVVSDSIGPDDDDAAAARSARRATGAGPPPLPDETGEFLPRPSQIVRDQKALVKAKVAKAIEKADQKIEKARDIAKDIESLASHEMPDPEELVPPGGEDDFFAKARSKENPILRAAAAADAERAKDDQGLTAPVEAKSRSTAPEEEAAEEAARAAIRTDGEGPDHGSGATDEPEPLHASLLDPTGIGDLAPVDLRGGAPLDDASSAAAGFEDGDDVVPDDDDLPDPEATEAVAEMPQPSAARKARDSASSNAKQADLEDEDNHDAETFIKGKQRGRDDEVPPTSARPPHVARTDDVAPAEAFTDDVPTGPLPPDDDDEIDADDDDMAFDVEMRTAALDRLESANTASLPAKESIPDLPSDALQALPSIPRGVPVPMVTTSPPPIPQAIPSWSTSPPAIPQAIPGLPGQMSSPPPSLSGQPARVPGLPGQSAAPPPPPPGLPGQKPPLAAPVGNPAAMGARPPTGAVGKGGLPLRLSAGSKVPFEQARKAEKIFEQALKDHSEGRVSSARMNAKLAAMYDPSIEQYRQFLQDLDAQGANAKPPGGGKPRELTLFEQASDAEGRGDFEKAIDLLEEAISLNPKAAALRNRLGVVLSIRLKRHTEAMEQLRIAIELEPGNIVYMNNFSKVAALLDSQLEKGGLEAEKKKNKGKGEEKVQIKKMRPKMF